MRITLHGDDAQPEAAQPGRQAQAHLPQSDHDDMASARDRPGSQDGRHAVPGEAVDHTGGEDGRQDQGEEHGEGGDDLVPPGSVLGGR
ncbi:hypothetical protein [Streptomyces sp. CA-179760]|uniref:hypothetical protein n=1 Tax=Streptomyces sp. CA-179760 TaxID=3240054 RepID=UPI003D89B8AA